MKIAVIGTLNKDLIFPFQGESIQSLGGIYYTSLALHYLGGAELEIVPVSFVGEDLYEPLQQLFEQYPSLSREGLIPLAQKNHKVILEYHSLEERTEKALFNFPPLEWEHIEKYLPADFIIVNLITGWDLSLEAFLKLSKNHYSHLYLDVHYLVMGIDHLGRRYPRRPENVDFWLKGARFVQMNEREFNIIAQEPLSPEQFFETFLRESQVLLITHGSGGATLVHANHQGIKAEHFQAVEIDQLVDATGCGDVFGAGFVLNFLKTNDIFKAVQFANIAAGANCLLRGCNEMDRLPGLVNKILGGYRL